MMNSAKHLRFTPIFYNLFQKTEASLYEANITPISKPDRHHKKRKVSMEIGANILNKIANKIE